MSITPVTECWIFEGGGKIGRYVGGYHDARGQQEQYVALKQPAVKKTEEAAAAKAETVKRSSSKLSYKLQRELEAATAIARRSGGEAGSPTDASGGCFLLQSAA